ncbi:pPIWI_RE_Y domain-containing protein [Kitasatospora sp. NPDC004289]
MTPAEAAPDLELLGAVARSVLMLDGGARIGSFSLPYPPVVQLTLDRMVLHSLRQDREPPSGVPGLLDWCAQRPVEEWPLSLRPGVLRPGTRLLDPVVRRPTRSCFELASAWAGGLLERRALARLNETVRGGLLGFGECRDFLTDRPVLTEVEVQRLRMDPRATAVWRRVSQLYDPFTPGPGAGGEAVRCVSCRLPALAAKRRLVWCEGGSCPLGGPVDTFPAAGARVLTAQLRLLFGGASGRTERRVRRTLARLKVRSGPVDDRPGWYRASLPTGRTAVWRIHDRVQPTVLGAWASAGWTGAHGAALVVVPDRMLREHEGVRGLIEGLLPAGVGLLSVREFLELVTDPAAGREEEGHA